MFNYVKKIHLGICGEALAIASLGNLIGNDIKYLKNICGLISLIIIVFVTLKIILCFDIFISEIKDINILSTFPAYFMTFMILSTYVNIFYISKIIWILSFSGHLATTILFSIKNFKNFKFEKILPNWFIIYVAYASVSITSNFYDLIFLGQIFLVIGLLSFSILFPVMLYRVLVLNKIPQNLKSTCWLFNSPINICIVGYICSFSDINKNFLLFLLSISIFSLIISILTVDFKSIKKIGFSPSLSAFTFPTVIMTTAYQKVFDYFLQINSFQENNFQNYLFWIINLFKFISFIVVFLVLINYIFYSIDDFKINK